MEFEIRLIDKEEIFSIIPFLSELNSEITNDVLESRLSEMVLQGYQCVVVYDSDELVAISGIWLLTKYYIGKHIEPDNVFVLPEYQGRGIGKLLINWIFEYAKSIGCVASELNCYTKNTAAQRFWKQQGYELVAYHFQKQL